VADTPIPEPDPFAPKPRMRPTYGEVLADGNIIELVTVDRQLLLLHFDGKRKIVVPHLDIGSVIYSPPRLEPSLYAALKFPRPPTEPSSVTALFNDAVAVFKQRGFSTEVSYWGALFSLASWLPEWFLNPPILIVYGGEMQQAAIFFALLNCTCRRPFFTAELCRSLPFQVRPTLLILAPPLSAKACAFWRASNVSGVRVPTHSGAVESFATAKALFVQESEALAWLGTEAWRVPLAPNARCSLVSEQELNEISNDLQPKMLAFRLERLLFVTCTNPQNGQKHFTARGHSRQVSSLVDSDREIVRKITPLLEDQRREFLEYQRRDPYGALVECLWSPSHASQDKKQSTMYIKELTMRLNVLLRSRGETLTFLEGEVGWKLRHLGLPRQRNGKGMFMRFSADVCRQLHQLAHNYELKLPKFDTCTECNKRFSKV